MRDDAEKDANRLQKKLYSNDGNLASEDKAGDGAVRDAPGDERYESWDYGHLGNLGGMTKARLSYVCQDRRCTTDWFQGA